MDELYMQRCFELAALATGNTSPNPLVGSVIVHKGRIIGEGYHHQAGFPHAEVEAIRAVKDQELLKEAVLYVNLEPCSHHGRTPPCADLIIQKQIKKVVISTIDTNRKVAGQGIERMRAHGIEVVTGVSENQGRELNKRFFCVQEKERPYIILKWAQSGDGFLDRQRLPGESPKINWITGETARKLVHRWRAEEDAILVGTHTAIKDNPSLTLRDWPGKQPLRIVIDRTSQLPAHLALFNEEAPTLVFSADKKGKRKNVAWAKIDFSTNVLNQIMRKLVHYPVNSVIIEGGAVLLQSFIDAGLWDEARVFTGAVQFKRGIKAPVLPPARTKIINLNQDMLMLWNKIP